MLVADICTKDVVTASRGDALLDAARKMRERHVGAVVVVEEHEGRTIPVGVVTDRDVVVEAVVPLLDKLPTLTVDDLMMREIVTVNAAFNVDKALEIMSDAGVRRAPVVDQLGALVGIVTVDDLVETLAARLIGVVGVIRKQQASERKMRARG
ncbi:MAG: CBS domain-containing protein [Myxococcales bacterium]|nr:CBS domain-containing protein [Myxococcales bacterium]MCB9713175.1 CBS domain-containing protein [Myxococcales bacterium]